MRKDSSELRIDLKNTIVQALYKWQETIALKVNSDIQLKKSESDSSVINIITEKESCCKIYEGYCYEKIIELLSYIKNYEQKGHNMHQYYDISNNNNEDNNNDMFNESKMDTMQMVDFILNNIKENQMKLYNIQYKRKTVVLTCQITIDLWLIYLILRRFPFAMESHKEREKYFKEFLPYKNWPDPVGSIGYLIYITLVNDLYLPGITLIQDIRRIYMIDIIDPKKFLLNQNHFCRFISYGYKCHQKLQTTSDLNQIIKQSIINKSNEEKNENQNNNFKIKDFASITIVHLLIFFGQMFYSYNKKSTEEILVNINDYFSRAIPECRCNQKLEYDLLTKNPIEIIKNHPSIQFIYEKNIARNTNNKNLLISFFNIIDGGIKMNYYDNFLPIIHEVIGRLNINKISIQSEIFDNNYLMNLNKYYKPRIHTINDNYNNMYRNDNKKYVVEADVYSLCENQIELIENNYLSHLEKLRLEEFNFTPEQLTKVNRFNDTVYLKRWIFHTYFKMNLIVDESELSQVINNIYYDIIYMNTVRKPKKEMKNDELQLDLSPKIFLESIMIFLMPSDTTIKNDCNKHNTLENYLRHNDIIYHIIHKKNKNENSLNSKGDSKSNNINNQSQGYNQNQGQKYNTNTNTNTNINAKLDLMSKLHLLYFTEAKNSFNMQLYGIKTDLSNTVHVFYSSISFEASRKHLLIEVDDNDEEMNKAYNSTISNTITTTVKNITTTVEKKQSFKIINLNSTCPYGKVNAMMTCLDLIINEDIIDTGLEKKDKKDTSIYAHGYEIYQVNKLTIKNISGSLIELKVDTNSIIQWNHKEKIMIYPINFSSIDNEEIDEAFDFKLKIATFCNLHSNQ